MNNKVVPVALIAISALMAGCSTINSTPYKASTTNVIAVQQSLGTQGKKVSLGNMTLATGVEESPLCRMLGPVKVSPGKSPPQYIRDAFQEELFMAQVYQPNAASVIETRLDALSFSSVTPASWSIGLTVSSNASKGYAVSVKYPFDTSFGALQACQNVADAFGPAVQELLKQVVMHPEFSKLAK